jgi:hypothetical protein
MTKLGGAESVIVGTTVDAVLSMIQLEVNAETMPTVLALEEDLAHVNRRVESGHGQQGK